MALFPDIFETNRCILKCGSSQDLPSAENLCSFLECHPIRPAFINPPVIDYGKAII
jgi:hypothetical protein